jgi:hypothetical protein
MIERGRRARLSDESLLRLAIGERFGGKEFDGDTATEFRVLRQVHFAHSARAELRVDFVAA